MSLTHANRDLTQWCRNLGQCSKGGQLWSRRNGVLFQCLHRNGVLLWVHGNRLQPVAKGSGATLHELLMPSMSLCTLSRQSCMAWNQQIILGSTLLKSSITRSNFSRISFIRPSFTEELSVSVAGLSAAPSSIVIGSSSAVLSQRKAYLLLSFIITSL